MRKKHYFITAAAVSAFLLASCGTQAQNADAAQNGELDALRKQYESLQKDYSSLKEEYDGIAGVQAVSGNAGTDSGAAMSAARRRVDDALRYNEIIISNNYDTAISIIRAVGERLGAEGDSAKGFEGHKDEDISKMKSNAESLFSLIEKINAAEPYSPEGLESAVDDLIGLLDKYPDASEDVMDRALEMLDKYS